MKPTLGEWRSPSCRVKLLYGADLKQLPSAASFRCSVSFADRSVAHSDLDTPHFSSAVMDTLIVARRRAIRTNASGR